MSRCLCLLFCGLLALCITEPIAAKRNYGSGSGRHSYPSSGGLSGHKHSYPSSGGLSGGGHGYPSGGLSGNSHGSPGSGSHGYPSNTQSGSHGYPSNTQSGSHAYPSNTQSGSHAYPSNTQSGSHGYPSGKGMSGNTQAGHTTNVHYHYNYNPPQQIRYTPAYGGHAMTYPVYQGSPPTYVYKYKDSGSKYGTLLAGLALLNLGTVAAGAYALSQNHKNYKPQPGEICKFGVKKDNGDYEETKIDCNLITSFIFQEQEKTHQNGPTNTTVITTTVTNVTTINMTHPATNESVATTVKPNPVYEMLPNGTLVPINVTATNTTTNVTNDAPSAGNPMTSSVMVTTTNTTTVTNALDVKGKPIEVTPTMQCYVIRHSPSSNMKRSVPCGLLQTYAEKSLHKSSGTRNIPILTALSVLMAILIMN